MDIKEILKSIRSPLGAFSHDVLMISVAWLFAIWLRFNLEDIPLLSLKAALYALLVLIPVQALVYKHFGLYRGIWRFASMPDLMRVIKAAIVGTSISVIVLFMLTRLEDIPRSAPILHAILLIIFLAGPRFIYRWLKDYNSYSSVQNNVLIIGAGSAGEMLARDLLKDSTKSHAPVGFLDDNRNLLGKEIHGVRVLGNSRSLARVCKENNITIIMLATPGASSKQMRRIVRACSKVGIPFRTLPRLADLVSGQSVLQELREVSINDLLGRDQITLDKSKIKLSIKNKIVLVSGAGGSIGSELVRQICSYSPSKVILFDNSEYSLYKIEKEIALNFPNQNIEARLLDVTDSVAIRSLLRYCKPYVIFHAAAYKHVPMLESQVRVALKNNVIGTRVLAEEASAIGVEEFVLVSTDKAVNPTNIMGSSKRIAELICQTLNQKSKTKFITVRFGNVLDSTGSVVPLFREQIKQGGPVTVTDPEITRYFMTIPEACQLIMQAFVIGDGGEIFVLDMGEPLKIVELARQMIVLSGKKIDIDISIEFIGLRPGEKMFEELYHVDETSIKTSHKKITVAYSREISLEWLNRELDKIQESINSNDSASIKVSIEKLVPEYKNIKFNGTANPSILSNVVALDRSDKITK